MDRASSPSSSQNKSEKNSPTTSTAIVTSITGSKNSAFSEPPNNKNSSDNTGIGSIDQMVSSSNGTASTTTMNCTNEISNHRALLLDTSSQVSFVIFMY